MQSILVLGAGKSSYFLLWYLSQQAESKKWQIIVCDINLDNLKIHTQNLPNLQLMELDIADHATLVNQIKEAFLVVSLLPPTMHIQIAKICLESNTHLATASYASVEMQALHNEAKSKNLIFLNEMGLDPGIDHMSAMQLIDEIRTEGGEISSFESYCGGLICEENCATNPWKYKFSWNPMNVILAGQGGMSVFRENNIFRQIPWYRLFGTARQLNILGYEDLEYYPNRNSLEYETAYGLASAETIIRGTLRRSGFSAAWQVLVQLGFTDNAVKLPKGINTMSKLCETLLGKDTKQSFSEKLLYLELIKPTQKEYFDFLEMDSSAALVSQTECVTSAALLRLHLEKKWALQQEDKDEVIMIHKIGFKLNGKNYTEYSVLQLTGTDSVHTAMAKTVGLPLAFGAELIMDNVQTDCGVCIPTSDTWYRPVLKKLAEHNISFKTFRD